MNGVQSELSVLESRHVSFIEKVIDGVEEIERMLDISECSEADWREEEVLHTKLRFAHELSSFYYNALLQLIGKDVVVTARPAKLTSLFAEQLSSKGLTAELFDCWSLCTAASDRNDYTSSGLPDLWSLIWMSSPSQGLADHEAVHVLHDGPISGNVVNPDALKQAILSRQFTTSRITARSNFSGDDRHHFVSYLPIIDLDDAESSPVQVVLQQIHELESGPHVCRCKAAKLGLQRMAKQMLASQKARRHLPRLCDSDGNDSLAVSTASLRCLSGLLNCADAYAGGLELTETEANSMARLVVELLAGNVGDGVLCGVFARYCGGDPAELTYASATQLVGRDGHVARLVNSHLYTAGDNGIKCILFIPER